MERLVLEPIGVRAAPRLTLEALTSALRGQRLGEARVFFITDWQDRRGEARYALLLQLGRRLYLTPDAFGPAFLGGEEALAELLAFLEAQGARRLYEAIIPPGAWNRLYALPAEEVLAWIQALANPADPALYRRAA